MTVVSRCVRGLEGIGVAAALLLSVAISVQAQQEQPDGFHVGDRIALTVEGPQVVRDTVVVRDGLILRLTGMTDISLVGVKRADVQKYLTQEISKFIKDPVVHATALVRLAVLGQVMRPGFYTVPSDALLSDVVMTAGGPTGTADLNRTVVKRGDVDVATKEQVASALSAGQTLDQLQVAPGDQLIVGAKPSSSFDTILKVVGVAIPLLSLALYFSSRR
ncbi:MAG TPA: SLBB domain-containing protein [Gemmatimonadaceae bacterium]|jgi:polysaccharide export outer membrane protein